MMENIFTLFFEPGEVCEIRALGVHGKSPYWEGFPGNSGIVHGYFDNAEQFLLAARVLEESQARGVYFTLNPVNPVLIARAANRLIVPAKGISTSDQYIECIRWLPIDLDPKRPSGISSSEDELKACENTARKIVNYLEIELGFCRGIRGFSGNGYHILYRLPDLSNTEEMISLIRDALSAIHAKFDSEQIDIDLSVFNPSRIWKLYGTTARKGDSITSRPHRLSCILSGQPTLLKDVSITGLDLLKALAGKAPVPDKVQAPLPIETQVPNHSSGPIRPMTRNELGPLDMEKYLTHFGLSFDIKDDGTRSIYRLERCIFNPEHGLRESSIVVPREGAITYQCFHSSCKRRTWKEARYQISGEKSLAEFCQGFDPNWKPPRQTGTGIMQALPIPTGGNLNLQNINKLPAPIEVDPHEFYEKKGKRPVFVPHLLAKYLAFYLHPLRSTNNVFYRYEHGLWKEFKRTALAQIIVQTMKDEIQASWISNVMEILSAMVNFQEDQWKDDIMLLNVQNGMLNLGTRELLAHDPKYDSRVQLPMRYDPQAYSGRWDSFLKDIFFDDRDFAKIGILQQFIGYCFLRDARYQKALFLIGTGANGKSTMLDVMAALVGTQNLSSLTLHDLQKQFRAQFLQHKFINLATETGARDPITTEIFKQVVDGSLLTVERKYGEPYQYRPYAKWVIAMNEAPVIQDKTHGFERRVLVLEFNRRFGADEIIENFAAYLIQEIEGIFNWAMNGLFSLLKNGGFRVGSQIRDSTEKLLETINPVLLFVKECCEISECEHESTIKMWSAYKAWCAEGKNRPLGRNKFYETLLGMFPQIKKDRAQEETGYERAFMGIHLFGVGIDYAEKGIKMTNRMFGDY
jgi:P4 family phage/plasmid primase-like protien